MKIIPVKQGSEDWLSWRREKITASDAGVILRLNRYTNPTVLWEEKMGITLPKLPNKHMKRGTDLEPIARELFIEYTGIYVEPLVVQHDEFDWLGASLDGISKDKRIIVEIKCPMIGGHAAALLYGEILPMYKAQMQHQLFLTDAGMCYYVTYNQQHDPQICILEVTRDEDFIQEMIEAETVFYREFMCGFKKPPLDWKYKKAT